jgi:hypothetical protein
MVGLPQVEIYTGAAGVENGWCYSSSVVYYSHKSGMHNDHRECANEEKLFEYWLEIRNTEIGPTRGSPYNQQQQIKPIHEEAAYNHHLQSAS